MHYRSYKNESLVFNPTKDLMCYKCHNWSNPSHSNCLEPDNETPLVNCTEMYAGYELGQIVCESSESRTSYDQLLPKFLGLVLTERFDGRPPEIEEVKRGCAFEQQTTDYITRFANCIAWLSRLIPIYQF